MIETLKYKKLTWIDIESPTAEEMKPILEKYHIHPVVGEELLKPTYRPRSSFYSNFVYVILHIPVYDVNKLEYVPAEIDFIIGKNFLITVHYRTISPLNEMVKILEADAVLKNDYRIKDTGALFFFILKQLYSFTQKQLDHLQAKIDDIGQRIFEKSNRYDDLVRKISHVRKDTLDLRKIIQLHREICSSLEKETAILGKDFPRYLSNINGEFLRIWHIADNQRETIASLQSTTDSLLNHRSNEIMKNLALISFITFPLMLLSSMFGMNAVSLPIIGITGDFWIIVGVMVLATGGMYTLFKRRKWL